MPDSGGILEVGSDDGNANLYGDIFDVSLYSGIGGSKVLAAQANPNSAPVAPTSWTATSGETWTLARTGPNAPDVASDLTVAKVSGLPSTGKARVREFGATVSYFFPATYIATGVPCSLALKGFANSSIGGAFQSSIVTYDDQFDAYAFDSATTNSVTFVDTSLGVALTLSVAPTLSFSVNGRSTTCNGQTSGGFQASATSTAVPLGRITAGTTGGGAQDLLVQTNAANGFAVYIRTTGATPNAMRDASSHYIADVGGSAVSPGSAPVAGVSGFGYTTSDATAAFASNKFAKLTSAGDAVLNGAAPVTSASSCVGFQASTAANDSAGSYSVVVVYTAVPRF